MKIAIEAQRVFRKKKHGMDIVALELIRHLQLIDKVNEYFILVRPDHDSSVLAKTDNFHIIEIPGRPYPVWEQYYLPKIIKKIKPDIIHCTSNTAPINAGVPTILTLHDILFMQKIDLLKGTLYQRLGNMYRKWIVPKIIYKSKKIITVSNYEKGEIQRFFSLPFDGVKVIYNSYNPNFKQIADKAILTPCKQKYNLPNQFVLYLGNTHPNKNLRNVLKAFHSLRDKHHISISLVMPDIKQEYLDRILREQGTPHLKDAIILTGYVPNDELKYIFNLATIFLYPSFYESFGIPMIEAMACGIPVIASSRAAMPEISGDSTLMINPDSPDEIANAIKRILSDSQLYAQLKDAGLRRASFFSWSKTASEMVKIYETAAVREGSLLDTKI